MPEPQSQHRAMHHSVLGCNRKQETACHVSPACLTLYVRCCLTTHGPRQDASTRRSPATYEGSL